MAIATVPCVTSTERLAIGDVKRVEAAQGLKITSLTGDVWVTQLGDPKDHILGRGQSMLVDHDGSVLVSALGGPAVVCVSPLPTVLLAA